MRDYSVLCRLGTVFMAIYLSTVLAHADTFLFREAAKAKYEAFASALVMSGVPGSNTEPSETELIALATTLLEQNEEKLDEGQIISQTIYQNALSNLEFSCTKQLSLVLFEKYAYRHDNPQIAELGFPPQWAYSRPILGDNRSAWRNQAHLVTDYVCHKRTCLIDLTPEDSRCTP